MTGLCGCGCGERTRIATKTKTSRGEVKGQPQRFLHGHAVRRLRDSPVPRIEAKTRVDADGCWRWTGALSAGYGVVRFREQMTRAHRAVYQLLVGEIPEGMELHHECFHPECVNPAHLRVLTVQEHRALHAALVTHCRRERHELTPENTYVAPTGERSCKECRRGANERHKVRLAG